MRKLRIGIIDLVSKCPTRALWARVMFANFASIMPLKIPCFYVNRVQKDLGELWSWLPEGAVEHDPNAYLTSTTVGAAQTAEIRLAV